MNARRGTFPTGSGSVELSGTSKQKHLTEDILQHFHSEHKVSTLFLYDSVLTVSQPLDSTLKIYIIKYPHMNTQVGY